MPVTAPIDGHSEGCWHGDEGSDRGRRSGDCCKDARLGTGGGSPTQTPAHFYVHSEYRQQDAHCQVRSLVSNAHNLPENEVFCTHCTMGLDV